MLTRQITASQERRRRGLTLPEILIAVLLMSIGVISLATLFPISVIKSARAAQLTNATIHRFNAEEFLTILTDPTADGLPTHNPAPGGRLVVVVDPIGAHDPVLATKLQAGVPVFGNQDGTPHPGIVMPRTDGANGMLVLNRAQFAADFGTLPDSWDLLHEGGIVTINANTVVQMPAGFDELTPFADGAGAPESPVRITFTYTDGRTPVTRDVTLIAGTDITFAPPLPAAASANPANIIARFESRDSRYTWLMTVRKSNQAGTLSKAIDVVIYFNRRLSEGDEQIYESPTGSVFRLGSPVATVHWNVAGASAPPELNAGDWVLDAVNGHWYKLRSVAMTGTQAIVTLDRPAVASGNGAIFPRGVVDVYPLGSR